MKGRTAFTRLRLCFLLFWTGGARRPSVFRFFGRGTGDLLPARAAAPLGGSATPVIAPRSLVEKTERG
jgi:hypothetical protein